jgi:hypothetical protein
MEHRTFIQRGSWPMMAAMTSRRLISAAALACAIGLAGCGSSGSDTPDTTLAETTVAAAPDTTAVAEAAETTAAATETTATATETTAAAATETTAAAATETSVAGAASDTLPEGLINNDVMIAQMLGAAGIAEADLPGATECFKKEFPEFDAAALSSGDDSSAMAKMTRAMLKCGGDSMLDGAVAEIDTPGVSETQKKCIVKATFDVILDRSDEEMTKLLNDSGSDMPAEVKNAVKAKAKSCGVDDATLEKVLNEGSS